MQSLDELKRSHKICPDELNQGMRWDPGRMWGAARE